jgi:hypothetical protein
MTKHEQHPLWQSFAEWCTRHGVSLDSPDDWFEWWSCYTAGGAEAVVQHLEHRRDRENS